MSFLCLHLNSTLSPSGFLPGNLPARLGLHGHSDRLWNELPVSPGGHTQRPRRQELRVSGPDFDQSCCLQPTGDLVWNETAKK